MTRVFAIRGATTLDTDSADQMLARAPELVSAMCERNELGEDQIISMIFTATPDIVSMFPPTAVRTSMGLANVPMMGAVEMDVSVGLPRCVRVMMHVSASDDDDDATVRHVYLHGAVSLRPDLEDV